MPDNRYAHLSQPPPTPVHNGELQNHTLRRLRPDLLTNPTLLRHLHNRRAYRGRAAPAKLLGLLLLFHLAEVARLRLAALALRHRDLRNSWEHRPIPCAQRNHPLCGLSKEATRLKPSARSDRRWKATFTGIQSATSLQERKSTRQENCTCCLRTLQKEKHITRNLAAFFSVPSILDLYFSISLACCWASSHSRLSSSGPILTPEVNLANKSCKRKIRATWQIIASCLWMETLRGPEGGLSAKTNKKNR